MTIKVTSCSECPFNAWDSEYGFDCNLKFGLEEQRAYAGGCPLRSDSVTVELK